MKIEKFDMLKDGGTIVITTDNGIYCVDSRIQTTTYGRWYDGIPKDDNSNIIENSQDLENEIIKLLKNYKDGLFKNLIDYFINSKQTK